MEYLLNDHEDYANHHESSHKLYDEMGHPDLTFIESWWKLSQQHDQNFPMEGKPLQNKY